MRAGILITGNEVLNGLIDDRNGPWLSQRLRELGIETAEIALVADRYDDMRAALESFRSKRFGLILTSGGLGPTADDLTMAVVADFCGKEMVFDSQLDRQITELLRPWVTRNPQVDRQALAEGTRKQATIPQGATVLDPIGTAPGIVLTNEDSTVVVLPGPPRELQPMWQAAVETDEFKRLLSDLDPYRLEILRMSGVTESEIAQTLRTIDSGDLDISELEITTCLRRGELEVATRFRSDLQHVYTAFKELLIDHYKDSVFSTDGQTVDQIVAELLQGHTVATAESCTGGLLAGRLTALPGASEYFQGSIVTYSNQSKSELAGIDPILIKQFGAVSPEVAALLADGAMERFHTEFGVGVTGIAGPAGGSEEKPVGLVYISVAASDGRRITRELNIPGDRDSVRDRSCTAALQLLRQLLLGGSDAAV